MATKMEIYDNIYKNHPETFEKIKKEICNELNCDFVDEYLIKDYGTMNQGRYRCVEYAKIIPKIKYPDKWMLEKLNCAKYNETDDPVAFLVTGTIIHVEEDDDGCQVVWITDDEALWKNPSDYDELIHAESVRSIKYCIVANEFFGDKHKYSIENLRPGMRVMMSVFYLKTTSNPRWLQAAFTDIKLCSEDLSFSREYYSVKLDKQFNLITRDEYFEQFFKLAEQYGVIDSRSCNNQQGNNEGCYVATAVYGSYDCPQVWTLRRYRDYTLAETWYGRAFIRTYYALSPTLVKWFGHTGWFKKICKGKLDHMVADLQAKGVESTPYVDNNWRTI